MANKDIDIGLSVLCVVSEPEETLSSQDIADVCGCARNYIYELEKLALKKMRKKLNNYSLYDFIDG